MGTVEVLVAQIQGLSSTAGDISRLHTILKQSEELLHSDTACLPSALAQLDASKHSLGYLYILEAYTSVPISQEQYSSTALTISRFLSSCNPEQIRLAPEKFVSVCKRLKDQVVLLEAPIRGVAPLLTAIRKLQISSEHLTTIHPEFLLLCLLAKCYKTGRSILDNDILEVDQPRDLFLYCYYGGMICIGLKLFPKALELLHNAVSSPMSSMNAIAVEAYKKYILLSLIYNGQPYIELANSYSTGNVDELDTVFQTNREKFENDNNLGLVKQAVSSLYKRNIQRLTQTYLTLSLQDIANSVKLNSPKEAEMHVLRMIQDGEIFATINQKDGMVSFLEDSEQYKSCKMVEHIDSSIQRMMKLAKKLTAMDESISYDPLYLAKAGRERQRFDYDDFDSVPQKFNI
ncbi:COP9 signalosome complex subunit 3 isoform X2 [Cucurbita moschata]|uniref:COP9 signalosome complex subunit 3 n=1 Tax=Cucurbita moschata TaxID=3662 RepID=A0A6J1E561_CUCMO|nr:COP9 signalosome complex subunit 3 isoform X2 [Cucurbita moschata]